jgi:DeoR/GlpR family transcriptional regulator of sugar metabolism
LTSDWQAVESNDRKQAIAAYLKEHRRATVSELSGLWGLSKARMRSLLQEMAGEGVIEKIGDNRYTHYVLK